MTNTQLAEIDIKDLIKADWNYKTDGSEEQIEKLMNSIKQDKSVGVLAVREVDGKFEVIDGNHRLEAIIRMKWKKVPCENFGDISKGKAITIARRRNHKWFEDDINSYAKIFKDDVMSEFSLDELEKFMPDTLEDMENLLEIDNFDWDEAEETPSFDEDENLKSIKIVVPEETYNMWLKWKERVKDIGDYETDGKAFEYAIIEALNGTTEEV
jgi:hypothetical protein